MITVSMPQEEYQANLEAAGKEAARIAGRDAQYNLAKCVIYAMDQKWEYVHLPDDAPEPVKALFTTLRKTSFMVEKP